MVNDPIADMLIRIKNGYMSGKMTVSVPHSKVKAALAQLLKRYDYIGDITTETDSRSFSVTLVYKDGRPGMENVQRLSKPGLRRYAGVDELLKVKQGLGYIIISTPKGLMTHIEARKKRLGGELICKIW